MHQDGVPHTIVGEDGTAAVLNNEAAPEFVGYLAELAGIDMPPLRTSFDTIPEGDGGIAGRGFFAPRPFTVNGAIIDAAPTARSAKMARLERACLALRANGSIRWAEVGGIERALWFRTTSELRFSGKTSKEFQVGLTAADPIIRSWAEETAFDAAAPLDIAAASIVNQGTFSAWPRLRVTGALSGALRVKNETTGLQVQFLAALNVPAGGYVEINTDPRVRSAVLNTGANVYGLIDFANTTWPSIQAAPAGNRFTSTLGTRLDVFWRHAWVG